MGARPAQEQVWAVPPGLVLERLPLVQVKEFALRPQSLPQGLWLQERQQLQQRELLVQLVWVSPRVLAWSLWQQWQVLRPQRYCLLCSMEWQRPVSLPRQWQHLLESRHCLRAWWRLPPGSTRPYCA